MSHADADDNPLGAYLRDRRAKLDPAAFGFPLTRRRTPGPRREEVAQRANVSATWYTWLEQGRGGAPSADVLDRIARAMMLTEVEREHLFLLGLGRPPEVRYRAPEGITPRLQRVLDTLEHSPAFIRTATWDVVAWNRAAAAVLTDYGALPEGQRNVLRMMFRDRACARAQLDWQSVARYVVARSAPTWRAPARRADVQVAGRRALADQPRIRGDVARQRRARPWRRREDPAPPDGGPLSMEFSAFAVEAGPTSHGHLQPRDA